MAGHAQNNIILEARDYIADDLKELIFVSIKDQKLYYIKDNRIVASDCVNRPAEHMMSRKLISEKVLIDKDRLSDETIPIKEVAN